MMLAMAACIRDNSNIRKIADNTCSLRDERLWSVFTAGVSHDTSAEVLACCADLRVLGKGEFKSLLKWRLKMVAYRDELKKASANESDTEDTAVELNAVEQEQAKSKEEIEADIQDQIRDLRLK
eukprot:13846-Heterococcus_DN1.PRE.2